MADFKYEASGASTPYNSFGWMFESVLKAYPRNMIWGVISPDDWYVKTAIGDNAISDFINSIP